MIWTPERERGGGEGGLGPREAGFVEVFYEKEIPVAEAWCSWVLDEGEEVPVRRRNTLPALFHSSAMHLACVDPERPKTWNVTKS